MASSDAGSIIYLALSAGLYANETVPERAKRVVAEEAAVEEWKKESDASRKRNVAAASAKAMATAEEAAERDREEYREAARARWLNVAATAASDATAAAAATAAVVAEASHRGGGDSSASASTAAGAVAAPVTPPPMLGQLRLSDAALYQSRLQLLVKRLGSVLGSALPGAPPPPSDERASILAGVHGAADVDELASAIAARTVMLREDKTAGALTTFSAQLKLPLCPCDSLYPLALSTVRCSS